MKKPVEVELLAIREAAEAHGWYSRRSSTAAAGFAAEVEKAFQAIAEHPGRYPAYLGNTRRYMLRRYPYLIVFRDQNDRVQVIAIAHGKRRAGYWKRRIKKS